MSCDCVGPMTYSLPGKPRLEVSDNAQLSSGVVLEIVVGDYVLTVCYAAPLRVRDRVCMHASKEKIFSRKCENFYVIIISKFTKGST